MSAADLGIYFSDDYVITTRPILVEPTQSMGFFLFTNMQEHKDKLAQIDTKTDKRDTFGELLQRSVRTALHMEDKIKRDDVITICTKNHLDSAVPYIATQFLGAKVGSIDPSFTFFEMTHILDTIRPKMIFTMTESIQQLEKTLKEISLDAEIVVFDYNGKHTDFSDFVQPHKNEETFKPVEIKNLKDTAAIYFSSGTTGLPKGICLSHYSLIGQMVNTQVTDHPDEEAKIEMAKKISFPMTHLCYTSFYWLSAGFMLLGSVKEGYCRLICDEFDGKVAWDLFEKYKPMMLMITPVQAIEILANKRADVDLKNIVGVVIIGSSLPKNHLLKVKETFPDAFLGAGYGQTELAGGITFLKPLDKLHRKIRNNPAKLETTGVPLRGASLRVVDTETGKNLGPNKPGELLAKTPFITNGYYNKDSSETFDNGWLKTGDIVYYDEEFCFYHVDRIKEAFKYQGWFIAPAILEAELLKHPAVKIAVVIGIPKDDGHHPMGLVVLNEGFKITEKEIEKFVEEKVSDRQRLRAGVKFITEVPLTATGKIKRRELKQMVLEGNI